MTLSCRTSSRSCKQNCMTLNKMMRQWRAEQTGMLRHSVLLLFLALWTVEYYWWLFCAAQRFLAGLFESTIFVHSSWYSVRTEPIHTTFKDGWDRWSYRYRDKYLRYTDIWADSLWCRRRLETDAKQKCLSERFKNVQISAGLQRNSGKTKKKEELAWQVMAE